MGCSKIKDTTIGIASVIVIAGAFSLYAILEFSPKPEFVDTEEMIRIHDTVVRVDLMSYTFDDQDDAEMILRVVEFWKNPTDATHLTVKGNLHEFQDYCKPPRNCKQAIAYLYKDDNGIYYKGDYWEWVDDYEPTRVDKILECYEFFHCTSGDSFDQCLSSKRDNMTIAKLCSDPNRVSYSNGCISIELSSNLTATTCY